MISLDGTVALRALRGQPALSAHDLRALTRGQATLSPEHWAALNVPPGLIPGSSRPPVPEDLAGLHPLYISSAVWKTFLKERRNPTVSTQAAGLLGLIAAGQFIVPFAEQTPQSPAEIHILFNQVRPWQRAVTSQPGHSPGTARPARVNPSLALRVLGLGQQQASEAARMLFPALPGQITRAGREECTQLISLCALDFAALNNTQRLAGELWEGAIKQAPELRWLRDWQIGLRPALPILRALQNLTHHQSDAPLREQTRREARPEDLAAIRLPSLGVTGDTPATGLTLLSGCLSLLRRGVQPPLERCSENDIRALRPVTRSVLRELQSEDTGEHRPEEREWEDYLEDVLTGIHRLPR